jgi:hypothetical protein
MQKLWKKQKTEKEKGSEQKKRRQPNRADPGPNPAKPARSPTYLFPNRYPTRSPSLTDSRPHLSDHLQPWTGQLPKLPPLPPLQFYSMPARFDLTLRL